MVDALDLLATAEKAAMMANMWTLQLRTSGGSSVPDACRLKPMMVDVF